jgi:hypothetical protein
MFEVLFIYPKILARHQAGPAAVDRERYLAHCAGQSAAHGTLLRIARELLVIAERIDVTAGKSVTRSEIDAAARAWARRQKRRCRAGSEQWSRYLFAQVAAAWLRFPGILEDPPHSEGNAFFSGDVDEFIAHLRDERGLSPNTVGSRRRVSVASCATALPRSSGMPRNDGGALPESQRPSTRHACPNRKGCPEVLAGATSGDSSTTPADANRAMYATTQF